MSKFYTSESVTQGHPDKLCDYISDTILDCYIERDKNSRVACETMVSKNKIFISEEINTSVDLSNDYKEKVIRNSIKKIGYDNSKIDLDYKSCEININTSTQSPDISMGLESDNPGAGDQGIVYGFACNETKMYMPLSITLANKLAKRLEYVRKKHIINYLRPDGKVQITIEYINEEPRRIDSVVVSAQHIDGIDLENIRNDIFKHVIIHELPEKMLDKNTKYYINPTGRFVIGGPLGDTGLTGRKIMVDTYGTYSKHGGGAFSGKDGTKIDRSGAYMARHIAKNIVANKLAKKCEIQLVYVIGIKEPVALNIDTFGTESISENNIINRIYKNFDLTPKGMIEYLKLDSPIFKKTTNYGHFGRGKFSWEEIIEI